MLQRNYSVLDRVLIGLSRGLRTVTTTVTTQARYPGDDVDDVQPETLTGDQRRHVVGLFRVDHAGEVAAQALYEGQAAVARDPKLRQAMEEAAEEEIAHLVWCRRRLNELSGHTSALDPLWYIGSFAIGATAGLVGDRWSLGFIRETENQVVEHLQRQLQQLPPDDQRSRAIIQRMSADEADHASRAAASGAAKLPLPVRGLMRALARVMTTTAYWV